MEAVPLTPPTELPLPRLTVTTPVEATYQSNGAALLLFAVLLRTVLYEVPLAKNLAMITVEELPVRNPRLALGTSMNCCGKAGVAMLFVKWMTGFPFKAPGMRVGKEELNVDRKSVV